MEPWRRADRAAPNVPHGSKHTSPTTPRSSTTHKSIYGFFANKKLFLMQGMNMQFATGWRLAQAVDLITY